MTREPKANSAKEHIAAPSRAVFRQGNVTQTAGPLPPDGINGLLYSTTQRRHLLLAGLATPLISASALARAPTHTAKKSVSHHHALTAPAIIRRAAPLPPLVMLDPGHGGKDPGAIGLSGTYEKHVSEAAAAELERQLLSSGRYRVAMTRTADRFIPLEGRVEMAQNRKAALFISMHADALHDPSVRGASVYTLANTASDAQTATIASSENSADLFGGPHVHATSPEVQKILASLVSEETRRGSAHMAHAVVSSFHQRVALLQHPNRHAAFVVLKAADIPSVLVEMGFMSNRQDEAALRQAGHRAMVAGAMRDAIDRYFAASGPGIG
ncbi:N-acetylmuramoyl-L-alanine amidase [Acetobacter estunensis NRIC 0472]|uniref:N-acetylmuramoyl-L-alanine amidase n=1 Tax=Acetobacter estunensis TaxID=104097 RepID=A0A967EIF0_9PROT|nr:N-acetylmuramoyl-L-alanine amidase [Acetobacter estunensis]NHO55357.1 N-acetylmuramoyl-L-alanine amidase [Acetobacter estunensis]GBQ27295.1 N-acetylmuramoyl-L-alanine amidase [Acetobacter estunensis NRIC 0472]